MCAMHGGWFETKRKEGRMCSMHGGWFERRNEKTDLPSHRSVQQLQPGPPALQHPPPQP